MSKEDMMIELLESLCARVEALEAKADLPGDVPDRGTHRSEARREFENFEKVFKTLDFTGRIYYIERLIKLNSLLNPRRIIHSDSLKEVHAP